MWIHIADLSLSLFNIASLFLLNVSYSTSIAPDYSEFHMDSNLVFKSHYYNAMLIQCEQVSNILAVIMIITFCPHPKWPQNNNVGFCILVMSMMLMVSFVNPQEATATMSSKFNLINYNSRKHISISIPSSSETMSPHIKSIEELRVLGVNLSSFNTPTQFFICVTGVFLFYLIYGYLQVKIFCFPPITDIDFYISSQVPLIRQRIFGLKKRS